MGMPREPSTYQYQPTRRPPTFTASSSADSRDQQFDYLPEFSQQQGRPPRLRQHTAPGNDIAGIGGYGPQGIAFVRGNKNSPRLAVSYAAGSWLTHPSDGFVRQVPFTAAPPNPTAGGGYCLSYVVPLSDVDPSRFAAVADHHNSRADPRGPPPPSLNGPETRRPVWLPSSMLPGKTGPPMDSSGSPYPISQQPPGPPYNHQSVPYRPQDFAHPPHIPPIVPINDTYGPSSNPGSVPSHIPPPPFSHSHPPSNQARRPRRWTDTAAHPLNLSHVDSTSHDQQKSYRPLIPPPPTSLTLTTSERYRRAKELAANPETGYMAGGGGGQDYRPYGGEEYRIVKENYRRTRLATGLGPSEDEEWKTAYEKAQRMRFYAEQVRQANEQKLQSLNDPINPSHLHTGYWKQI